MAAGWWLSRSASKIGTELPLLQMFVADGDVLGWPTFEDRTIPKSSAPLTLSTSVSQHANMTGREQLARQERVKEGVTMHAWLLPINPWINLSPSPWGPRYE